MMLIRKNNFAFGHSFASTKNVLDAGELDEQSQFQFNFNQT